MSTLWTGSGRKLDYHVKLNSHNHPLLSLSLNLIAFPHPIAGDWHTAYILLYGPSRLEILKEEKEEAKADGSNGAAGEVKSAEQEDMDTEQEPST